MTSLLNRSLNDLRKSRDPAPSADKSLFGKQRTDPSSDTWKHDLFQADEKNSNTRAAAPSSHAADRHSGLSNSLLITNLHYDVSEAELEALFAQIGKIDKGPLIKFDQSGRATEGLAFISYANESHAEAAIKAFDGASAKGQPIGVSYEFGMPNWVRSALGLTRQPRNFGAVAAPAPGLLGRIQQDKFSRRSVYSPYDSTRSRGARAPYPPLNPSRAPPAARDGRPFRGPADHSASRHDTFASGARSRGELGPRGRGAGERSQGRGVAKSAQELDRELEAFMDTPVGTTAPGAGEADVQMME